MKGADKNRPVVAKHHSRVAICPSETKRPVATPFCSCVQFSPRAEFQMLHVQFSRKIPPPFMQQQNYSAPNNFAYYSFRRRRQKIPVTAL